MLKTQEQLEADSVAKGLNRLHAEVQRVREMGDITQAKATMDQARFGVILLVDVIDEWLETRPKHSVYKEVGAPALAFYAVKGVYNANIVASRVARKRFPTVLKHIGRNVLEHAHINHFYKEHKNAYKWLERQFKERRITGPEFKRHFFNRVAMHLGVEMPKFDEESAVRIGQTLVKLMEVAGMIELRAPIIRGKTQYQAVLKDGLLEALMEAHANPLGATREAYVADRQPMIEPPKPWTGLNAGGYHTPSMQMDFVIGVSNGEKDKAEQRERLEAADLSKVYEAVNAIDQTAFRVNERVLEVMAWAYKRNLRVDKFYIPEKPPQPEKPKDIATNEEALKNYKMEARKYYEFDIVTRSKVYSIKTAIDTAHKFKGRPIWFPSQLDFRGRVYSLPVVLNPQGPDYVKGLLEFNEGKHVSEAGLHWLKVHGANCFGYDKVSMQERVDWVDTMEDFIRAIAQFPMDNLGWTEADKPFQFLAWCFDYIEVIDHGKPSHSRVGLDGSCNGLQHFSAMLRDPVGAKAVNLAQSDKPSDIYQMVADVVTKKLKGDKGYIPQQWLAYGIDRKMCKRSVMVMPYGGKWHSTMKYVEEEFHKRVDAGEWTNQFGDQTAKACNYLAKLVFNATREVVVGGKIAMDWLQEVADIAARNGVRITWSLPTGFVASNAYNETEDKKVRTWLESKWVNIPNKTRREKLREEMKYGYIVSVLSKKTEKINRTKSVNSLSPNFVHSLDAAALQLTVLKCKAAGINSYWMVHDDYGTHAEDTPTLVGALREAFVEIYRDHDVLADLKAELPGLILPKVPKKGKFNLEEVLTSEFFFA